MSTLALPPVVHASAAVYTHGDESSDTLRDDAPEELESEDGVVLSLRAVTILEDIKGVAPVPSAILQRIRRVWVHLVHDRVDLVVKEELPYVG